MPFKCLLKYNVYKEMRNTYFKAISITENENFTTSISMALLVSFYECIEESWVKEVWTTDVYGFLLQMVVIFVQCTPAPRVVLNSLWYLTKLQIILVYRQPSARLYSIFSGPERYG